MKMCFFLFTFLASDKKKKKKAQTKPQNLVLQLLNTFTSFDRTVSYLLAH